MKYLKVRTTSIGLEIVNRGVTKLLKHTGQWFLPFIHKINKNNDDYDENNDDDNNGCSKSSGTNGAVTLLISRSLSS